MTVSDWIDFAILWSAVMTAVGLGIGGWTVWRDFRKWRQEKQEARQRHEWIQRW